MKPLFLFILLCSLYYLTFGIDIPGLECVEKANRNDFNSILKFEKGIKGWFLSGKSEYGIAPMNPLRLKEVVLISRHYTFILKNVIMSGFPDMNLIYCDFISKEKEVSYGFDINLNIKIGSIIDKKKGKCLNNCKHVNVKIENMLSNNTLGYIFEEENGVKYMYLDDMPSIRVHGGHVVVNYGKKLDVEYDGDFSRALGKALAKIGVTVIAETWIKLHDKIPYSDLYN